LCGIKERACGERNWKAQRDKNPNAAEVQGFRLRFILAISADSAFVAYSVKRKIVGAIAPFKLSFFSRD